VPPLVPVSVILRSVSRWMLVSMIPLSVILWGGTRPWTAELISWGLSLAGLCFLAAILLPGSRAHLDGRVVGGVLMILIPGWIATLNGTHVRWLPGSINTDLSFHAVTLAGGTLASLLISLDAASSKPGGCASGSLSA